MNTKEEQLYNLCKTENFNGDLPLSLIEGIDLNKIIMPEDTTFLYTAICYGNLKVAEFLLKNGADPNVFADNDGPLLWNLQYGNDYDLSEDEQLSFVKLALDCGANPSIKWDSGVTLMEWVLYEVFNEIGDNNWEYLRRFLIYLIAYGGKLSNGMPEIYHPIDKNKLNEYKFFFTENGGRGEIIRNGETVAYI